MPGGWQLYDPSSIVNQTTNAVGVIRRVDPPLHCSIARRFWRDMQWTQTHWDASHFQPPPRRVLLSDVDCAGRILVDKAIAWIALAAPGQTPAKYGCVSWRQVLHAIKLFDMRKAPSENPGGPRRIWYRARRAPGT